MCLGGKSKSFFSAPKRDPFCKNAFSSQRHSLWEVAGEDPSLDHLAFHPRAVALGRIRLLKSLSKSFGEADFQKASFFGFCASLGDYGSRGVWVGDQGLAGFGLSL